MFGKLFHPGDPNPSFTFIGRNQELSFMASVASGGDVLVDQWVFSFRLHSRQGNLNHCIDSALDLELRQNAGCVCNAIVSQWHPKRDCHVTNCGKIAQTKLRNARCPKEVPELCCASVMAKSHCFMLKKKDLVFFYAIVPLTFIPNPTQK